MAEFNVVNTESEVISETKVDDSSKVNSDVVEPGKDIEGSDYGLMAREAIDSFVERALQSINLPVNKENSAKALDRLVEKINTWLEEGDFELDLAKQVNTEEDVKKALMRRGLDDSAESIRKLIDELKEKI